MTPAGLAVRGGTVIEPTGPRVADVLVAGERIAAVTEPGALPAARSVDARGLVVVPGAVDAHVHVGLDYRLHDGRVIRSADRIGDASRAAAVGGTTTIVDFAMQVEGEGLLEPLRRRRAELDGGVVDVGLHCWMLEANDRALAEIPALVAEGVPSLKLFLAYSQRGAPLDDGALLDVWHAVADAGGLVQAHCENAGIIGRRLAQASARATSGYDGLAASRPPVSEVEAVRRAVSFAEASGAETYCVHLSTAGAVEAVRRARADGLRVHGECCPHHLLLHEDRYAGPRAGDFVMSPPLRAPEHAEALWRGLADGTLEVIAADHAAWPAPFKAPGPSFLEAVHGAAGNGLLLPLLSAQVGRQPGFGWEALARVTAEAPARIFRLPGKGAIRAGYDADLVLLDPARQAPVPAVPPHWQVDNGIFRGLPALTPRLVLRRGVELARDGAYVGPAAGGRFVAGTLSR